MSCAGPSIESSGSESAPAPPSKKWVGPSMWVPLWTPIVSLLTLAVAPSAIALSSSISTPGLSW